MPNPIARFGIIALLILTGCATLISGTNQAITVNSSPGGAEVRVNGIPVGQTPYSGSVSREDDTVLLIRKNGYDPQTQVLPTKINVAFWGNIICCGLLGSTTDYASGAAIEYSPNSFFFTLHPTGPSPTRQTSLRHQKARDYILHNYDNLAENIVWGNGEYLASLYTLLKIQRREEERTLETLRAFHLEHRDDIPTFANAVVQRFAE